MTAATVGRVRSLPFFLVDTSPVEPRRREA